MPVKRNTINLIKGNQKGHYRKFNVIRNQLFYNIVNVNAV